jgi:hypothetical protein|tara:strand:+ start:765 stop:1043 length:279 start_codon:yes stop_codon:yes gene_type:complete
MFKKGDLVRLASEDEEKEIVSVLEDSDESTGTTLVQLFVLTLVLKMGYNNVYYDDGEKRHLDVNRFDTEDLELATITTAEQLKRQFGFWGKT